MKALKTALPGVAIAIFAFPSVATAEYLVPPGNSAVNQYTESVPTAGGHKDVDKEGRRKPSPAKVLGEGKAEKLEQHGAKGREAAEVAAATAPASVAATSDESDTESGGDRSAAGTAGSGGNGGGAGGGGTPTGTDPAGGNTTPAPSSGSAAPDVSGSSGLSEVLAQATGSSSSGQLGLLLPLILLGALAWGVAFLLRQRKRPTT